ncbi:contact-dependent growth inhibition system immunity protein [Streptomyces sp. B1866]|uniref:contact-dependent growth inhibition system immunity protein n=1 Tax=Streptomyces sp. B1866 TaxID=3075431 RepID=UPI0028928E56|nr:contact-dependent growth inhibition system immunity protein [Streptomyces sp. B1866]MDT3397562.1 contact-dependent growth inhibition system immunity protein [Streptomyces sp. B1866]
MSLKPLEHDRDYGELDQVVRAYLGQVADDGPDQRSDALTAYLRHTWHTRPWAVAVAEEQLREYARSRTPSRRRARLNPPYPVPDVGLPDTEARSWLLLLADHLKRSVENGDVPPPGVPRTHWEWHARFPELGQLLGGWFSQDMPKEFADHDTALADYLATTDPVLVARLSGELTELLTLPMDEADYARAVAELGMEVEPPAPYAPSGWLTLVADRLTGERAPGP